MGRDVRELLLVRQEEILNELAAGTDKKVFRDQAEFESEDLPAYVLLDGTETKELGSSDKRGPQVMRLDSQIFYVPHPSENPKNENIGPNLSAERVRFLKAFLLDGRLQDLTGDNGYIEYRGMETDMQTGGEVKGQFRLDFAFAYVLNVSKL